jgi:hypothetical protein
VKRTLECDLLPVLIVFIFKTVGVCSAMTQIAVAGAAGVLLLTFISQLPEPEDQYDDTIPLRRAFAGGVSGVARWRFAQAPAEP